MTFIFFLVFAFSWCGLYAHSLYFQTVKFEWLIYISAIFAGMFSVLPWETSPTNLFSICYWFFILLLSVKTMNEVRGKK